MKKENVVILLVITFVVGFVAGGVSGIKFYARHGARPPGRHSRLMGPDRRKRVAPG